jgi:SAM-dependent methyltransferase
MDDFREDTYGQRVAAVYDEWYADYDPAAVATLHRLAGAGRALELGIGTGRIALPLLQAGTEVHGIDASEAMVARLRAKPGGATIPVSMGNFADVAVDGAYALIYVVFNTFFALLTQDEQLRCMQNVAEHLEPDGVFVLRAFVPDLLRYTRRQALSVVGVRDDAVRLDASELDPVTQLITSEHMVLSESGVRLYPVRLRYAWPTELDLMARLAGMRLRVRWGDWQGGAFSAESTKHVSIYARA